MIRNLAILLLGILPASYLSLFAIGIAALGVGRIGNGFMQGWVDLVIGLFGVLGTASLFGVVLFGLGVAIQVGLFLGCVAGLGALFFVLELDQGSLSTVVLVLLPVESLLVC